MIVMNTLIITIAAITHLLVALFAFYLGTRYGKIQGLYQATSIIFDEVSRSAKEIEENLTKSLNRRRRQ